MFAGGSLWRESDQRCMRACEEESVIVDTLQQIGAGTVHGKPLTALSNFMQTEDMQLIAPSLCLVCLRVFVVRKRIRIIKSGGLGEALNSSMSRKGQDARKGIRAKE